MIFYIILLVAACAADLVSSEIAFKHGGREINPLAVTLAKYIGRLPANLAIKAVVIGIALLIDEKAFYVIAAVMHVAAAAWNANVIRKLRAKKPTE